ncbi:MAG: hypothetical protein IKV16_02885 [Clostridia bacterium]|nr:hypothetical protein [Clostridia bacterium]
MKILAVCFMLFSSLSFAYMRIAREKEKFLLICELYCFIETVEREISCYLKPLSEICASYSSPLLSSLDFFSDINTLGAEKAYYVLEKRVILPYRAAEILHNFFSRVGRGYVDDELKLTQRTLSELFSVMSLEGERFKKERTLTLTLSSAASFGVIILLI